MRVLLILLLVGLAPRAATQDVPDDLLVLEHTGTEYGYSDSENPDLGVFVVVDGVILRRGKTRLFADTLVLTWRKSASSEDSTSFTAMFDNDRIVEVFLDGHVTVEEDGVTQATAESLLLDNASGKISLLEGSWRALLSAEPLIVRFQLLRQLSNRTVEAENLTYTNCDFEHAHWGLDTAWALLIPTDEGRIFKTAPNFGWLGPVNLAPMPGFHVNADRDRPPLRKLGFGNSGQFGFEINTLWQGNADDQLTDIAKNVFGVDTPVEGLWQLHLDSYSSRGVFIQPIWQWKTQSTRGRVLASFIQDRNKYDLQQTWIEDSSRGRILIQHRWQIDDKRTLDAEFYNISDRGFRREFDEGEVRRGKDPESYLNYREVDGDEVRSVLVRGRANDFVDRREYLPQVSRRIVGRELDLGPFGTGFVSGRDFADYARLRTADELEPYHDPDLQPGPTWVIPPTNPDRSQEVVRVGVRRQVDVPFEVGDDRIVASAAVDLTGFDRHIDDDPATPITIEQDDEEIGRYALIGGVSWSRTYSGSSSDYHSDLWNLDGVRQVIEPSLAYRSVLELNQRPADLVQIDEVDRLDKRQVFLVGLRHRIQTRRNDRVMDVLNTEVLLPIYPNEIRDNPHLDRDPSLGTHANADPNNARRTMGDLSFDMTWTPQSDIPGLDDAQLQWRGIIDPNSWAYVRSVMRYRYTYAEGKSFFVAQTKQRPRNRTPVPATVRSPGSNNLTVGAEWVLSQRWSGAVFVQEDLRLDERERVGFILRQKAHKWVLDLEVSRRRAANIDPTFDRKDKLRFSIRMRPMIMANRNSSLLTEIGQIRRR